MAPRGRKMVLIFEVNHINLQGTKSCRAKSGTRNFEVERCRFTRRRELFLQPRHGLSLPINYFKMTKFRPCIDLHSGQVKQIVGGTLTTASTDLQTNYVSKLPASHFAKLYKDNHLDGAHVIMLGPGNAQAAKEALAEWPASLQVGGGITDENAKQWIDWGAERVIAICPHTPGRNAN